MGKNRLSILSLLFVSMICASCTFIFDTHVTSEVNANVYKTNVDLSTYKDGYPLLDTLKISETIYRVIKGEELVPYFSLTQYESMFTPLFAEYTRSEISDNGYEATWHVSVHGSTIFYVGFNYLNKYAFGAGSLASAFKDYTPQDVGVYLENMKYQARILNEETTKAYMTINYSGYGLDPIKVGNRYYAPLGLIDLAFSNFTGREFYFTCKDFFMAYANNYNSLDYTYFLLSSGDTKPKNPLTMTRDNSLELIDETFVAEKDNNTYAVMPMYLRKYNRSNLYLLFDNLYGLKYVRNISSMKKYFESLPTHNELIDKDATVRADALAHLIGDLNDGHTAVRSFNILNWGEYTSEDRYYGPLWKERLALRNSLVEERTNSYKEYDYNHATSNEERQEILDPDYNIDYYAVRYSDDNKLAFWNFDQFTFELNKEALDYDLKDTYAYFLRQFKSLKDGVEDVVIDLSTNGGGIVIALMKILALISKNNNITYETYNQGYNMQQKVYISVDSNKDGKYDADDVYGDDYNIYLLTSPYSFSCGNAYPFYAKKQNLATIIGQTSGGGECTVDTIMLPNGQYISHSSLNRIGVFNPNEDEDGDIDHYEFEGDEAGAIVEQEYQIGYSNYYNFNYLRELISQVNS